MTPKRAAIYARISRDTDGLSLGVTRQREDCQRLAKRLGWTIWGEYVDNDISAYSGRRRPSYERMIADIEAGRVDGILCWDVDRLTRRPIELEKIIELADSHGVALASVGGAFDLADPQGRLFARQLGAHARYEAEHMSSRIRRQSDQRAEAGRPHGYLPYGWRRQDGRNVRDALEAPVVEEIVDRILAGEAMTSIARDLQARDIPPVARKAKTAKVKAWNRDMIRQLALRASNAGLRVHRGQVITQPGNWEPIISRDKYERVSAYLMNPERRLAPTNNYRYLLSGIARCGLCGGTMRVMNYQQRHTYACSVCFKIRRRMEKVDEVVEAITIRRLQYPDALRAFAPPDDEPLLQAADHIEDKLALVAEQYGADMITGDQLLRITRKLRARLDEIKAQLPPPAPHLTDLIVPGMVWEQLPIERKRAIIALLFDVTILPARQKGARFDPRTVVVAAKGAPAGSSELPAPPSPES